MQEIVTIVEKEYIKTSIKVKIIKKLEIITIIQVNIEVQHILFAILNLLFPMKSLYFS